MIFKKLNSFFFIIVSTCITYGQYSYDDGSGNVYNYQDNGNGTAKITGYVVVNGNLNIPNSINGLTVTEIGYFAFYNCQGITGVTITNSVFRIGVDAFYRSSLKFLVLGNRVNSIGANAFDDCSLLKSVDLGTNLTSIEFEAFIGTKIENIFIPKSLSSIGRNAFDDCKSLTAINVDASNGVFSSLDGVLFSKNQATLLCYPSGKQGDYIIPNSVTSIGNTAFVATDLTSVTIPNSVTLIGQEAFSNCRKLSTVFFKGSAPVCDDFAFGYSFGYLEIFYSGLTAGWSNTLCGQNTFCTDCQYISPIFLNIIGNGLITGPTNGQVLYLGSEYTVSAKPASGARLRRISS